MDKNVIKILENQKWFNWYFNNRDILLILGSLLLVVATIYMVKKVLCKGDNIEYKTIFGQTLIHIIIAIIIGNGLNAAGLKFEFTINHMPILLFSSAMLITVNIQLTECFVFYRNFQEIIKRTNIIIIGIIEVMVLLLSIMGRLEIIEIVAAVIANIVLKISNDFIDNCTVVQNESGMNNNILMRDYFIEREEDLFKSRKKQLDIICKDLEEFRGEPFAIAISGEWGSGKTSFVNVLRRKLKLAEFVNVECSIEYDVKAVLMDISSQIQKIYKQNNVFTNKNGIIQKYFEKIGELVDYAGYGGVAKVIDKLKNNEDNSYWDNKVIMNQELETFYKLTKKRIYFIIDDMDRIIDDRMRDVIFQVMKESVELHNCVTLFMFDYDRLKSERMSREFLEKYVNYQYELCDIEFGEIVEYYNKYFLDDSFWLGKSNYIVTEGKKFKKNIMKKGDNILFSIQNSIKKIEDSVNDEKISKEDQEANRLHLNYLSDAEIRLHKRMMNPRKVKRYFNDIQKKLTIADLLWFQEKNFEKNEYSQENWIEAIQEVSFLKIFLFEEYDELIKAKSFYSFKKDEKNSYIVEFILSGFSVWLTLSERREMVEERVVYRLYALDIDTDKTQHQRLMEEIETGFLQEDNINLYVKECLGINFNSERMQKILNYLEKHDFKSQRDKCEVILNIMSIISGNYDYNADGLIETMKRIKDIVDKGITAGIFNEKDRRGIEHYTKILQTRLIFGNSSIICNLLEILHNTKFEEYFKENVDNISQLHSVILKINESHPLSEFEQKNTELETLINYFKIMKEIFYGEEFHYVQDQILYFGERVKRVFEILQIWFGKPEKAELEESIIEKYYDRTNGVFKQNTLENVNNLIKALDEIEGYISNNQEDIKPGGALIQLFIDIEERDNSNPDYWGKEKSKVILALSNTYEHLEKNQTFLQAFSDRWIFCKVRIFRMRRNMNM